MVNTEEKDESLKDALLDEALVEEEVDLENDIPKELDSDNSEEGTGSEIEKITLEKDEIKDQLIRSYAENENIRKRAEKEKKEAEIYGITKMSRDILTVYDNLQRALDLADDILDEKSLPMIEGLELTKKDLLETFKRNKIDKIEPELGEKFNPKLHQAMFEGPSSEIEKGSIMQVLSIGFSISDRLLRAAHVAVSSGKIKNIDKLEPEEN
ncbi:MAG: nucleotide exchange factor GrpE [Paracoccaceae bacterium]|nr:nucleotide exchange factor GrpE [Paracoccaceae bacterium]